MFEIIVAVGFFLPLDRSTGVSLDWALEDIVQINIQTITHQSHHKRLLGRRGGRERYVLRHPRITQHVVEGLLSTVQYRVYPRFPLNSWNKLTQACKTGENREKIERRTEVSLTWHDTFISWNTDLILIGTMIISTARRTPSQIMPTSNPYPNLPSSEPQNPIQCNDMDPHIDFGVSKIHNIIFYPIRWT